MKDRKQIARRKLLSLFTLEQLESLAEASSLRMKGLPYTRATLILRASQDVFWDGGQVQDYLNEIFRTADQ